jgi:hypothetical protein
VTAGASTAVAEVALAALARRPTAVAALAAMAAVAALAAMAAVAALAAGGARPCRGASARAEPPFSHPARPAFELLPAHVLLPRRQQQPPVAFSYAGARLPDTDGAGRHKSPGSLPEVEPPPNDQRIPPQGAHGTAVQVWVSTNWPPFG